MLNQQTMETKIEEIWKDVVGYEGYYQVSNTGKVKSLVRIANLKNQWGDYSRSVKSKILKPVLTFNGRPRVDLLGKLLSVSRLVAFAFIDNPHGYPEINHIDGNPMNNYSTNLEWCTRGHNMKHAHDTGLIIRTGRDRLVLDITTGVYFDTLKSACTALNLSYTNTSYRMKYCKSTTRLIYA
jgi:hypothetical protein